MPTPRKQREPGVPTSLPEGDPSIAAPHDHSFTLQAVMEMQKSIGALGAKIDALSSEVSAFHGRMSDFGEKLDKVRHWQSVVSGGAIVVAAVAAVIWSVITFVPWERIHIEAPKSEAVRR